MPAPGNAVQAAGRDVGTLVAATGRDTAGTALAVLLNRHAGPFTSSASATQLTRNSHEAA